MTAIIFIAVLVVLILVHELGHFLFAKWSGIRVDEFGLGFPPRIWGYKPKGSETTYTVNAIPFGGFVKIYGEDYDAVESDADKKRSFIYQAKWKQVLVLAAGVLFNVVLAWILFSIALMSGVNYSPDGKYADRVEGAGVIVANVLEDSPAYNAGLKAGDKVVFVSSEFGDVQGDDVDPDSVTEVIKGSEGGNIEMLVNRGGESMSVEIEPDLGIVEGSYAIGVSMVYAGTLQLPVHLALVEGISITKDMSIAIVFGFVDLIKNIFMGSADLSTVVGPVGIAGLVGDAASLGFVSLISFMGMISLHLAVLNLIPFPALDGGRILFVIIEKIKGSPLNARIMNMVNLAGFLLLILLLIVVTFKDVLALF